MKPNKFCAHSIDVRRWWLFRFSPYTCVEAILAIHMPTPACDPAGGQRALVPRGPRRVAPRPLGDPLRHHLRQPRHRLHPALGGTVPRGVFFEHGELRLCNAQVCTIMHKNAQICRMLQTDANNGIGVQILKINNQVTHKGKSKGCDNFGIIYLWFSGGTSVKIKKGKFPGTSHASHTVSIKSALSGIESRLTPGTSN